VWCIVPLKMIPARSLQQRHKIPRIPHPPPIPIGGRGLSQLKGLSFCLVFFQPDNCQGKSREDDAGAGLSLRWSKCSCTLRNGPVLLFLVKFGNN